LVLGTLEGAGMAFAGERQFPVRYWITVFAGRGGMRGRGKIEMPTLEAVRAIGNSQFKLELENGQSITVLVTATSTGPIVDIESTGPIPGY